MMLQIRASSAAGSPREPAVIQARGAGVQLKAPRATTRAFKPKLSKARLTSLCGATGLIVLMGCSFDAKPAASPTPTTKPNTNTDPLSGLRAGRGGVAGRTSSGSPDTDAGAAPDAQVADAAARSDAQTTTGPGDREDAGTRNPQDAGKTPTEPRPDASAGSPAPEAGRAGNETAPSAGVSGSPPAAGSSAQDAGTDASQPSVVDQLQGLIAAGICLRDARSCVALCIAVSADCDACVKDDRCRTAMRSACGRQITERCEMQASGDGEP